MVGMKDEQFDNLVQAFDRIVKVIVEDNLNWMDALLKDAFNPESFFSYATRMGADFSHITQRIGKPGGLDPYQILQLQRTATDGEVRKRYRELSRQLHPDTAGIEGTSAIFDLVTQAYHQIEKERGWH
jgi:DnaJ-domain-containing protein 1